MKKTLCALAVLGAFAGTSLAADVTLYGIVDEGLLYSRIDQDTDAGATDKLELKSGIQGSSRFGFKGAEEIGNGLKVGFILENGFTADDGVLAGSKTSTLFDREASLYIEGGFGKLGFGKIGAINQGTSSWGKLAALSAFGTGFGDYIAQAGSSFAKGGVYNNMIAYQTPTFGGVQVFAQYSLGTSATGVENTSSADRYYALGAAYNGGPLALYAAVDSTNYATWNSTDKKPADKADKIDDSLTVTLGGSYDFGVTKVHLGVQYFDEVKLSSVGSLKAIMTEGVADTNTLKGYAVSVSNKTPVLGGSLMLGVSYIDAETTDAAKVIDEVEYDVQRIGASAAYTYALSKRTSTYAMVGYWRDSYDFKAAEATDRDASSVGVALGIRTVF